MRNSAALFHSKMTSAAATAASAATFSSPPAASAAAQRSPWHSPVPYLFGGLAAMLGLIAFALLILACSYWKISGAGDGDVEAGEKGEGISDDKAATVFEEKLLVIMAGDNKPTFLATPAAMAANKAACFSGDEKFDEGKGKEEEVENVKEKDEDDDDESQVSQGERS